MALDFATIAIVSLALFSTLATADISAVRYNRFERLTTRLQRQELSPTPYPAAGYRPSEPFDFPSPDKQEFLPDGDDVIQPQSAAQPQPQPQVQSQSQFQPQPQFQSQPQFQPQSQLQPQPQPEVNGFDLEATPNLGSNGDHIDAPNALYDAPSRFRQTQPDRQRFAFSRQQFSSVAQRPRLPQNFQQTFQATTPQRLYGAPADNSEAFTRQRQQFATAQQSVPQKPQSTYDAPTEEEPQAERLISAEKSQRLTAAQSEQQREEREDEAEVATDIEVTEVKKPAAGSTPAPAAPTPTTGVFYYPAGAVGFVHPLTAAYYQPSAFIAGAAPEAAVAAAAATAATPTSSDSPAASPKPASLTSATAIPAIAPIAAPQYFAASPYLQQYTFAAPAQLQAW